MNVWNFTGNIGKTAEKRFTPGGDCVVSFSVAVKSGFGDKAKTTWANCALWGKRGEAVAEYLTKGQQVGISGEVTLREYESANGKGMSLDVRVNEVTLLGGKQQGESEAPARSKPSNYSEKEKRAKHADSFEDDIPW